MPKRCRDLHSKEITTVDEMVGAAALELRRCPSLVIQPRRNAAGPSGSMRRSGGQTCTPRRELTCFSPTPSPTSGTSPRITIEPSVPVAMNIGLGLRSRPRTLLVPVPGLAKLKVSAVEYPRLRPAALRVMQRALRTMDGMMGSVRVVGHPDLLVTCDEPQLVTGIAALFDHRRRLTAAGVV